MAIVCCIACMSVGSEELRAYPFRLSTCQWLYVPCTLITWQVFFYFLHLFKGDNPLGQYEFNEFYECTIPNTHQKYETLLTLTINLSEEKKRMGSMLEGILVYKEKEQISKSNSPFFIINWVILSIYLSLSPTERQHKFSLTAFLCLNSLLSSLLASIF